MAVISQITLERERQQLAWMIGYFFAREKKAIAGLIEAMRELEDDILFLDATGGSAQFLRDLRQTAFSFDCRRRMYLEQRAKNPEKDQFYHGRYEEAKEAQKILEDIISSLEQRMKKEEPDDK